MRYAKPMVAGLALLAACGTPQEQCIGAATRDLAVVDRLIAEAEGNLARGYGFETVTVYTPRWVVCPVPPPPPPHGEDPPKPRLCLEDMPETLRQPVALDLEAEARKLAGLTAKRAALAREAAPRIAACKADYPE